MAASVSWKREEKVIKGINEIIFISKATQIIIQCEAESAIKVLTIKVEENKSRKGKEDIKKGGIEPPKQG